MDLGAYQLQIFLSLFVVLGAAFVALVCDLLKGNNEQLRELNIELKVRREEEQKRFDILLGDKEQAKTQETPAPPVSVPVAVELRAERSVRQPRLERKPPAQEALAAMERGAQMASVRRRPPERVPDPVEIELPAQTAQAEQVVEHVVEHVMAAEVPAAAASVSAPPAAPASTPGPMSRDWSSLLNRRATPAAASQPGKAAAAASSRNDILEAVVAATDSTAPSQPSGSPLPAGFQDGFVLTRLVERRQPISGLVVSIGVTQEKPDKDKGSDAPAGDPLPSAVPAPVPAMVRTLIESLIGPADFAAQSASEEYLLIYPGVRGAAAQRRLSEVAQQLWDFQLRSMGQFSVQFSWGGVEVRSESIEEAIASATERMNETRRGRKIVSMDSEVRSFPKAG